MSIDLEQWRSIPDEAITVGEAMKRLGEDVQSLWNRIKQNEVMLWDPTQAKPRTVKEVDQSSKVSSRSVEYIRRKLAATAREDRRIEAEARLAEEEVA